MWDTKIRYFLSTHYALKLPESQILEAPSSQYEFDQAINKLKPGKIPGTQLFDSLFIEPFHNF